MPLGFLLPFVKESKMHTLKAFCYGFLLSLCAESIQLVSRTGAFDVDDIILNCFGVLIGRVIYQFLVSKKKHSFLIFRNRQY